MDTINLKEIIKELPEVYQQIYRDYGLNNYLVNQLFLITNSKRYFLRSKIIDNLCEILKQKKGRKLKILDLGSRQGFFSFKLAEKGHELVGVDSGPNTEFCNNLCTNYPDLNVSFFDEDIYKFIDSNNISFDLVLGLNIFHHAIYSHGINFVRKYISKLILQSEVFIFELALKEENAYWSSSLPNNPLDLLNSFKYNKILSEFQINNSGIKRPLIFSSNKFLFENEKLYDVKESLPSKDQKEKDNLLKNNLINYEYENNKLKDNMNSKNNEYLEKINTLELDIKKLNKNISRINDLEKTISEQNEKYIIICEKNKILKDKIFNYKIQNKKLIDNQKKKKYNIKFFKKYIFKIFYKLNTLFNRESLILADPIKYFGRILKKLLFKIRLKIFFQRKK